MPGTVTRAPTPTSAAAPSSQGETAVKIDVSGLSFYYGPRRALENINLTVQSNLVTALIGPSG